MAEETGMWIRNLTKQQRRVLDYFFRRADEEPGPLDFLHDVVPIVIGGIHELYPRYGLKRRLKLAAEVTTILERGSDLEKLSTDGPAQ